jgi:anti-anti-sigma factor
MSTETPTRHFGWSQPDSGPDPFEVIITRPTPTLTEAEIIGGLDIATCPELDVYLDDALHDPDRPRVRDVIVDLTRVELLSVAGVRSVLRAEAAARAEDVRLQLVINRRDVVRVLTVLGVDDRLCVRPDLATARRAAA